VPAVTARYVFLSTATTYMELFATTFNTTISHPIIHDYTHTLASYLFSQLLFDNSYPLPVPRPWVLLLQHVQRRVLQCSFRERERVRCGVWCPVLIF
jgi:hypothetical protein